MDNAADVCSVLIDDGMVRSAYMSASVQPRVYLLPTPLCINCMIMGLS